VANGILEWIESIGGWRVIYETQLSTAMPYRWTFEYLADWLYFAHPAVGLLAYSLEEDICYRHEEVGIASPSQVIAVSLNNGRLGVLTASVLAWSAPSNGLNFAPALGGAGAQVIAERVPGDPVMLSSYASGFMTWTTGGVMRSEFTGDTAVFRHRTLNTEFRPINSLCVQRVDRDTTVILDERGLFMTRGDSLQAYAPLFNEFLIEFLQERDFRFYDSVRIEWDDLQRRLYLSYADRYATPLYSGAYVYYPAIDKWGEFSEQHYGILPALVNTSLREDDYFGYVDFAGRFNLWQSTPSCEVVGSAANRANLYQPTIQHQVQRDPSTSAFRMPSVGKLSGFDSEPNRQANNREGYYVNGVTTPQSPQLRGLNASITLGLFRLVDSGPADVLAEVNSCIIRSVESNAQLGPQTSGIAWDGGATWDAGVTWLPPFTAGEFEAPNYVTHGFELVGTNDGLTDFVRDTPTQTFELDGARYYTCTVPGLWHRAEISAVAVGESFHVKTLELSATAAGRLL
jgi:hypothetical protein